MITHNFNTLDLLTSPVWIVSPFEEQLIYANSAARLLMQDLTFSQLRTGPYSVSSQKELPKYLSDLQNQHDIIEILTVQRKEEETALSCRLVLRKLTEAEPVIIFEGIEAPATLGLKASRSANYQRKKQGFYARFFLTLGRVAVGTVEIEWLDGLHVAHAAHLRHAGKQLSRRHCGSKALRRLFGSYRAARGYHQNIFHENTSAPEAVQAHYIYSVIITFFACCRQPKIRVLKNG